MPRRLPSDAPASTVPSRSRRRSVTAASSSATAPCIRRPTRPATRPRCCARRSRRCCRSRTRSRRSPVRCSATTISAPLDNDLIHNFAKDGDADRRAHHRPWPRARRERPRRAEHAGRVLAGQCRRPLPPQEGQLSRADRSEFRRLRPRAHRRRTATTVFRTVKPGPYPWPQLRQRLASRAHPFLGLRLGLCAAADHADVFRGRSADPGLPDRDDDPRQGRARAADRAARPATPRSRSTRSPTVRHRAARPALDLFENRLEGN